MPLTTIFCVTKTPEPCHVVPYIPKTKHYKERERVEGHKREAQKWYATIERGDH